jgi:hypothetical protein
MITQFEREYRRVYSPVISMERFQPGAVNAGEVALITGVEVNDVFDRAEGDGTAVDRGTD